jgi:uncharacterized membrane protein YhhN
VLDIYNKILLCASFAIISLIGCIFTIKVRDWRGEAFKVMSTFCVTSLGVCLNLNPLFIIGVSLVFLGDLVLSLFIPLFKKEYFFMIGLGLFLLAYLTVSISYINTNIEPSYLISSIILMVMLGYLNISNMNKCDIKMKIILSIYMIAVSSLPIIAISNSNIYKFIGGLLIYFSDSIIGHSSYNSKYRISSSNTELLITIPFIVGLFMYII